MNTTMFNMWLIRAVWRDTSRHLTWGCVTALATWPLVAAAHTHTTGAGELTNVAVVAVVAAVAWTVTDQHHRVCVGRTWLTAAVTTPSVCSAAMLVGAHGWRIWAAYSCITFLTALCAGIVAVLRIDEQHAERAAQQPAQRIQPARAGV